MTDAPTLNSTVEWPSLSRFRLSTPRRRRGATLPSHPTPCRRYLRWSTREGVTLTTLLKFCAVLEWTTDPILTTNDVMMNKEQEHVQCLRQYISKLADLSCYYPVVEQRLSRSPHLSSPSSWPSLTTAPHSRSQQDRSSHPYLDRSGSRSASASFPLRDLNRGGPSSTYDDNSTCEPSPVSPATPHDRPGLVPLSILKEQSRMAVHTQSPSFPGAPLSFSRDWPSDQRGASRKPEIVHEPRVTDARLSACRHSCEDDDSDDDSTSHPLRPW
jgi:hypothetical protein